AQGSALVGRDEPYPVAAALLAALLATAGAILAAFVGANVRGGAAPDPGAQPSPSDPMAVIALGIIAAAALEAWRVTGVFFPLRVRARLCGPVASRAAGQWLARRPDEQLASRSLLGAAPGLLAASVGLGLGISRGLWSWLDEVRAAEENSDSFLAATVRGQRRWSILLRQGLWLRRRRELGALLLAGMAGAVLIDVLSNTLIDSFRPPGFPPYPSLGAALFLRGATESGGPSALPAAWATAHVAV